MFYLRDVLELINDRLNNRALADQQLVSQSHQFVLHVAPRLRKELNVESFESLLSQLLRDVTSVSKDFAAQDTE